MKVLVTADGSYTVVDEALGESYHSHFGAETEARELFIRASGWKESIKSGGMLRVLDVGLGLGYNAVATIDAWQCEPKAESMEILSLEHNLDLVTAISTGDAPWMRNWSLESIQLVRHLRPILDDSPNWGAKINHSNGAICNWKIFVGDALKAPLNGGTDGLLTHIWQDAFSPPKNPDLWSISWFQKLRDACHPDAILVTYSVARTVKDALTEAGFLVKKIPATTKKRHWLKAHPIH